VAESAIGTTFYCYGSWRRVSWFVYTHAADKRVGGGFPSAGISSMMETCKNLIKSDPIWRVQICDGVGSGNWTVNTDLSVGGSCSNPDDRSSCSSNAGTTAFWANCFNGQVTTIGP
jgi:hypothetical protein